MLRLKFSQGYTNEEISKILKISEGNVRQRISRGKKKLAEILAKEGENPMNKYIIDDDFYMII